MDSEQIQLEEQETAMKRKLKEKLIVLIFV